MIIPADFIINKPLHSDDIQLLEKLEKSENILYSKKSIFNTINVTENKSGRFLKFDDSYQAGIINYKGKQINFPYVNYFLLSALFNPNIENVLILGMGNGRLIDTITTIMPELKNIDVVEIDPSVVDVSAEFFNFKANDKVRIHIQDAKIFLQESKDKYDLIILDVFSHTGMPYRFMNIEFMQTVFKKLSYNGIFTLNTFSSTDINSDKNIIFKSLFKTVQEVFNRVEIFPTNKGNIELYKEVIGLTHEMTDLTNVVMFASLKQIEKRNLHEKAKMLKEQFASDDLDSLVEYSSDLYKEEIKTDKVRILTELYENDSEFTLANLKNYLNIDHEISCEYKSVDPMDDEKYCQNR